MNIVQIGPFPKDIAYIKGGVEASVYGLSMELSMTNSLFVMDVPRQDIKKDYIEKMEGITIFRFAATGKNNYSSLFRLKTILSHIRKQNPDICHIHTTSLFSFFIYLLLKLFRISAIVTVHGLAHVEKQKVWREQPNIRNFIKYVTYSLSEFLFISACPILIVDTQYVADTIKLYKKQWKIIRKPICKVIPQGINNVFFQLENKAKNKHLLAVGTINKRKGHLFLIEAMEKVKLQFTDFSLAIVGALSDKKYFQLMQSSIKEKGLENNIKIYPNASFDEILKFYKSAEIFALHSEEESQGIVFCEAMAAGKPIVATNVGGVPWVVKNNVNGLLSDFGDIDAFANNVIKILEDNSLRQKMGSSNRKHSRTYNWKSITNEIMEMYTC